MLATSGRALDAASKPDVQGMVLSLVAKKKCKPAVLARKAGKARVPIVLLAMLSRDLAHEIQIGVAPVGDDTEVNRDARLVTRNDVRPGARCQQYDQGGN